ncbi:MAG: aldolase/citrate lyase family protein [Gemmatimonadales bacterium]
MSVTVGSRTAGIGSAGRRGEGIRSDLWVQLEARSRGGIELDLRSRVEAYYGDAIRAQVEGVLATLGVTDARVTLEDTGALPFVIQARLEAAALAAGVTPGADARPARTAALPPEAPRTRMRRSRLYLPGNEPKFFISAGLYGPDGIILDLEDSVHPDAKPAARLVVRNALRCVDFGSAERMIRINQLPLGLEDLAAVVPEGPDMILIPKVETADQVTEVDEAIDETLNDSGASGGVEGGAAAKRPVWLMPILESALGIENAFEIASASPRIAAITIGLEDYSADLGVPKTEAGTESAWARERLVNAAKAAGVQAIDSVYGQIDDLEGLRRWGERSREMGYEGMGCVHPRQIRVIHEAFRPPAAQIEKALKIVAAYEQARAEGRGVVSLGSKMIDPPVVRQALTLVEQARALGLTAPDGAGAHGDSANTLDDTGSEADR